MGCSGGMGPSWPVWLCAIRKEEDRAIVFVQWFSFGFVLFSPVSGGAWAGTGFIVWALSSLCVVNGTHLQTEGHVIVCLFFFLKKK